MHKEYKMKLDDLNKLMNIAEDISVLDNKSLKFISIIRTLIAEENTAAASYIEKAKLLQEMGKPEIAKVLKDIADEELVHAGELQALLNKEGLSSEQQALEGAEEVDELLNNKGEEL